MANSISIYKKHLDSLIINGFLIDRKDFGDQDVAITMTSDGSNIVIGAGGGAQHVTMADKSGTVNFNIFDGTKAFDILFGLKETDTTFVLSFKRGGIKVPTVCSGARVVRLDRTGGESAQVAVTIKADTITGT